MVKLNDYTMKELRKMIQAVNKKVKIKDYAKKNKQGLIDLIMNHEQIKVIEGGNAVKLIVKAVEKFDKTKTHKMPSGKVMTGKTHKTTSKEVKSKVKESKVFEEPPKKEKPKFIILKEEINDLLEQTKKSNEKNKSKLDKMTPLKYKNTIKKQNSKFLDEVKDIYNSLNYNFDMTSIKEVDKKFYEIIPKEPPKKSSNTKIKNDLLKVLNKHYGEVAKLEQMFLDGKITQSKYDDKDAELEEKLDDDLYNLKEKYNIKNFNDDTEFFKSMEGQSKKYINVLKEKSFGGFKSIPNYVKANKIGDKIIEKEKIPKKSKAEKPKAKKPKKAKKLVNSY